MLSSKIWTHHLIKKKCYNYSLVLLHYAIGFLAGISWEMKKQQLDASLKLFRDYSLFCQSICDTFFKNPSWVPWPPAGNCSGG